MTDGLGAGTGGFHGGFDPRNAAALAEAKATEAGLPRRQHMDAPRWADPGTLVRWAGLAVLGVLVAGWILTLLNAR